MVMGDLAPSNPRMTFWADYMARLPGGQHQDYYGIGFTSWWRHQIVGIEDLPYVGMEFCEDLELSFPPGKAWGPMGKCVFEVFLYISFFLVFWHIQFSYGCILTNFHVLQT
jgi:hypothetical protein